MVSRRRFVGLAATSALVTGSGCMGVLQGKGLRFQAKTAKTSPSNGYELQSVKKQPVKRKFAGQTVTAVNEVATYEKTLQIPLLGSAKLGVFALISTPAVSIAGKTFNPVEGYSNDKLVGMVASNYDNIKNPSQVGSTSLSMLGSSTTVSKYEASATFDGQQMPIYIEVTKVRAGDDFVVAVGVYPKQLDESDAIHSMMASTEHPA